jgi:hypothetical protein
MSSTQFTGLRRAGLIVVLCGLLLTAFCSTARPAEQGTAGLRLPVALTVWVGWADPIDDPPAPPPLRGWADPIDDPPAPPPLRG